MSSVCALREFKNFYNDLLDLQKSVLSYQYQEQDLIKCDQQWSK